MPGVIVGLYLALSTPSSSAEVPQQPCFIDAMEPMEKEIVRAVCVGNQARLDYGFKKEAEERARKRALAGSSDPDERYQLLRDWEAAQADLMDVENRMNGNLNRAIELSMAHYGIAPSEGEGGINDGPVVGGRAIWSPRYRGRLDRRENVPQQVTLPSGGKMHFGFKAPSDPAKRPGGITWPNGRVDVLDEVFDRVLGSGSPRQLGFILYHESVHFDQLRKGEWATLNEREVAAYRESKKAMDRFGLTKKERESVEALLKENIRHVQRQFLRLEVRPSNVPTPPEEAANADAWSRLETAVVQARADQQILRENLRREVRDRAIRESVAEARRGQLRQDADRRAREGLDSWARVACSGMAWTTIYTWDRLIALYRDLIVPDNMFDFAQMTSKVSCEVFLVNQIEVNKARRLPEPDWNFFARLDERWRDWDPQRNRAVPALPANPTPRPQPAPPPPPPPSGPDIDDGRSQPPQTPGCRYQGDWCRPKQ